MSQAERQPARGLAPKQSGWYVLKGDGGIDAKQGQSEGLAAIGAVLKDHEYRDVDELKEAIGWVEDLHVPEFKALIAGLKLARAHDVDLIRVFLDSALVVNSVNGGNLKPEHLRMLCMEARLLVEEFADIKICWVPREMNFEAHRRADEALGRT